MITAGIDAGSRTTKCVLYEVEADKALASRVANQGVEQGRLAGELLRSVLADAGVGRRRVAVVAATGYGRKAVRGADLIVTEITCHARGVRRGAAHVRTIIDIGGQDSKVIHLTGDGRVGEFEMNDRCAAGAGRFLEMVAARLGIGIEEFGGLAARSRRPARITSTCAVFAESEVVGLLASGAKAADIAAGVIRALSERIAVMAGRGNGKDAVLTGGVALVSGMDGALSRASGYRIRVAKEPRLTGALGAAILAGEEGEG